MSSGYPFNLFIVFVSDNEDLYKQNTKTDTDRRDIRKEHLILGPKVKGHRTG